MSSDKHCCVPACKEREMPKCRACGKYASNADCIRCTKCTNMYHRGCSAVPAGPIPLGFACQICKAKPADNISSESSSPGGDIMAPGKGEAESTRMLCELIQEVKALRSDLKETREEIKQFKADLEACSRRITSVEEKVPEVEKKLDAKSLDSVNHLENTIVDLRTQRNERDQELLLNDLEIAGLPEERNESVLHLASVVAVKLGLMLDERDIVHAERRGAVRRNRDGEGSTQQPRPLVVRLARRAQRDAMLRAARVRRGLTAADMNLAGEPGRFYVNERLTRNNRQLFGKAREAASRVQWKYVWTKDGRIFTRKDDGKVIERICSKEDIKKNFVP